MSDHQWDVFISHASEDKDEVARPLAAALKRGGALVWLDEHELKLGDSLSRKIDEGLARSRFGVVILSDQFFAKKWPKDELAGLRALEEDGVKVILPLWHGVDKSTVAKSSPVLADLLAASTSKGIDKVAETILEVIFSPDSGSPSQKRPLLSRRLAHLLDSKPRKEEFISFLKSHPKLLDWLFDKYSMGGDIVWNTQLIEGVTIDAIVTRYYLNIGHVPFYFTFLPMWESPFLEGGSDADLVAPLPSLRQALDSARRVMSRVPINGISDLKIFAGRRAHIHASDAAATTWKHIVASTSRCSLATYDTLVDALTEGKPYYGDTVL